LITIVWAGSIRIFHLQDLFVSTQTVFVLGGTGFIGQEVLRALVRRSYSAICLIHRTALPEDFRGKVASIHSSLERMPFADRYFQSVTAIIHLARIARSTRPGRWLAARKSARAHRKLIHQLQQQIHPPLLTLVAGTLAYGDGGNQIITENTPLHPISYARYYTIGEAPIVEATVHRKIKGIILRPAWVYGTGSWFLQFYLLPMRNLQIVPLYGDGKNWMSLIHVKDCARLIVHLMERGQPGETYNLFAGNAIQQEQLAEQLASITGLPIQKIPTEQIKKCFGKLAAEAFSTSQIIQSKHQSLLEECHLLFPDLSKGLADVVLPFLAQS